MKCWRTLKPSLKHSKNGGREEDWAFEFTRPKQLHDSRPSSTTENCNIAVSLRKTYLNSWDRNKNERSCVFYELPSHSIPFHLCFLPDLHQHAITSHSIRKQNRKPDATHGERFSFKLLNELRRKKNSLTALKRPGRCTLLNLKLLCYEITLGSLVQLQIRSDESLIDQRMN